MMKVIYESNYSYVNQHILLAVHQQLAFKKTATILFVCQHRAA